MAPLAHELGDNCPHPAPASDWCRRHILVSDWSTSQEVVAEIEKLARRDPSGLSGHEAVRNLMSEGWVRVCKDAKDISTANAVGGHKMFTTK